MRKLLKALNDWIIALFERHQFVRRSTLYIAWAMVAIAHVAVYAVVWTERQIDGSVVAIFASTCALVGTITKFYIDMRVQDREDRR